MAKTKISEFSSTPANNTDIDSINIAEGCAPSGINDAIRELMAQLKDFQTGAQGDSFNGPIGTSTAAAGAFTTLSATGAITSTLATGTAPLVIASTTKVANLNVDLLDGADWASPAALGSTTPAAVSATTLSASSTVTLSGGTANGVTYLNGSKVVTSGSALTFDGATLGVTSTAATSGDINSTNANGSAFVFKNSGTSVGWVGNGSSSFVGASASNFGINGQSNLLFGVSGYEQMRLTSTGLGIGTSSPQTKLHVAQSASGVLFGQDSTTANIIGTNAAGTSSQGLFLKGFPLTFTGSGGGGTAQMTLNGDGNLGLGVTPSAWGGKAFQIGNSSNSGWASVGYDANGKGFFASSAYNNTGSSWTYTATGFAATLYSADSGAHKWFNAPSGTAGNAITFTQAMTLDAGGRLLVGTTSSNYSISGIEINGASNSIYALKIGDVAKGYFYTAGSDVIVGTEGSNLQLKTINSGVVQFLTAGTERARIDSSGNFGIGNAAPTNPLTVNSTANASYSSSKGIVLDYTGSSAGVVIPIGFSWSSSISTQNPYWGMGLITTNYSSGTGALGFYTGGSERARIDSSGNLLLGATSISGAGQLRVFNGSTFRATDYYNASPCITAYSATDTTGGIYLDIQDSAFTRIGSISRGSSTTVLYNTSSDYRLKNITGSITTSGAYIDSLNPVEGTWKADGSTFVGLIAHEVQEASRTQVTTGTKDGAEMQAMDYSNSELIANLIAEVKSLRQRVAQLEAQ